MILLRQFRLMKKTITWKTDSTGQVTLLFNIARNVHQIRSKEVLCDYLYRAAGHTVKKTWLQAIKGGYFTTQPELTYELVAKFLPEKVKKQQQDIYIVKDKASEAQGAGGGTIEYSKNDGATVVRTRITPTTL